MSYSATKNASGTYDIFNNGVKQTTGAESVLQNYGLSATQLSAPQVAQGAGTTFNGYYDTGANSGQLASGASTNSGPGVATAQPAAPATVGNYYSTGSQAGQLVNQPASQPAPQPTAAQNSGVTVNVGTQPSSVAGTSAPTPSNQATTAANALTMPLTGSVVDLLNAAGQDSSFAAREQLAQKFGIQGYQGTAQQNTDLSQKYLAAFNANRGTASPQTGAQASSALDSYFKDNTENPKEDPQATFFDNYMSMNPVIKQLYDGIHQALSTPATTQTFEQEYQSQLATQGIPALQTQLMNIKNVMEGTEDDIRTEITKAGGFATDSQVQALSAARNKTLLKQANSLQQQLALKQDYVDQIMNFSKLDRDAVEKQVDKQLGLEEKLVDLQDKITTAAKDNYQKVVDKVGYQGLADALGGDAHAQSLAENALGLPKGALSNKAFLTAAKQSGSMVGSIQEYEYAKSQGYKGSFTDYQNEDANRKRSIAAAGVAGLTPNQINSTVNQIAGSFDNEPTVKEYNTIKRNVDTFNNLGNSATDDIQRVYTFAKVADPNSAVKEGEYASIEKYSQALLQRTGLKISRVFSSTGILTPEAREAMRKTLQTSLDSSKKFYDQTRSQYQRQIDDAYAGNPRTITEYTPTPTASTKTGKLPNGTSVVMYADGTIKDAQGNRYDENGNKLK